MFGAFWHKWRDTTKDKDRLGRKGEKLARGYLKRLGFKPLAANVKGGSGEIDLIMRDGDTYVFIEVKTRKDEDFIDAERAVGYNKRRHILSAAKSFIRRHNLEQFPCRFDVVIVLWPEKGKPEVRHYERAFGF